MIHDHHAINACDYEEIVVAAGATRTGVDDQYTILPMGGIKVSDNGSDIKQAVNAAHARPSANGQTNP